MRAKVTVGGFAIPNQPTLGREDPHLEDLEGKRRELH